MLVRAKLIALCAVAAPVAAAAENPYCSENRDSQALLIGNSAYQETIAVPYAHNDVEAIRDFLIDKLCYRQGNIKILRDATYNQLRRWLGRIDNPQGRLWNRVHKGRSNVFVYYSGHGVPDVKSKRAYLLPVDADPNIATDGYGLDQLNRNLSALNKWIGPRRTVTLVMDACFSGQSAGGALQKHSGSFTPVLPASSEIIRFSAAKADQLAFWSEGAKHGLFTKVFLEAVSGKADSSTRHGNRDGKVTGRELASYLSHEVSYRARQIHSREQSPVVPDADYIAWEITAPIVSKPVRQKVVRAATAGPNQESLYWATVKDTKHPAELEAFLRRYPDGTFADIARIRLDRLRTKVVVRTPDADEPDRTSDNPVDSSLSRDQLIRAVQTELARVGCYTSRVDGKWGKGSQRALTNYASRSGTGLTELDGALLKALKAEAKRVCPLVCGRRQVKRSGRCVAKTCPRGKVLDRRGRCKSKAKLAKKRKGGRVARAKRRCYRYFVRVCGRGTSFRCGTRRNARASAAACNRRSNYRKYM